MDDYTWLRRHFILFFLVDLSIWDHISEIFIKLFLDSVLFSVWIPDKINCNFTQEKINSDHESSFMTCYRHFFSIPLYIKMAYLSIGNSILAQNRHSFRVYNAGISQERRLWSWNVCFKINVVCKLMRTQSRLKFKNAGSIFVFLCLETHTCYSLCTQLGHDQRNYPGSSTSGLSPSMLQF